MTSADAASQDWLAHHSRVRPDKLAVTDLGNSRRLTFRELNERTNRLASLLASRFSIRPGDRVSVLSRNSANMLEAQFACWKLGAVFGPLNWRLAVPELRYIVGDSTPSVLIYDEPFADTAVALDSIPRRLGWDATSIDNEYEQALACEPADGYEPAANMLSTVLTLMYTSGTTGHPKGVIITHGMTLWNVVNQTEFFRTSTDMVNLIVLPMFHTGGLNTFAIPALHYGGSNVVMPTFDPQRTLDVLADPNLGITHFQAVPTNYQLMANAPGFDHATFPTLIAAGVGGASPALTLIERWQAKGVMLQQAMGMTETGSMVMALPRADSRRKAGSAGKPFLHNRCRVVDADGKDVAVGEVGELWMQGPNMTPGYWNQPEATAASHSDGWFRSGDAVRQDDEGYFYIVDRWKDMFISGGENVYPVEIENVIYQLAGVAEVAVIGVADERWQEVGRAYVVLHEGADLTGEAIIAHCRNNLAKFKVPKSVVAVPALPRNATGKILKRELRAAPDSWGFAT